LSYHRGDFVLWRGTLSYHRGDFVLWRGTLSYQRGDFVLWQGGFCPMTGDCVRGILSVSRHIDRVQRKLTNSYCTWLWQIPSLFIYCWSLLFLNTVNRLQCSSLTWPCHPVSQLRSRTSYRSDEPWKHWNSHSSWLAKIKQNAC